MVSMELIIEHFGFMVVHFGSIWDQVRHAGLIMGHLGPSWKPRRGQRSEVCRSVCFFERLGQVELWWLPGVTMMEKPWTAAGSSRSGQNGAVKRRPEAKRLHA